jgi:hypothetical protein
MKNLILALSLALSISCSCASYSEQVLQQAAKITFYEASYNGTKGDSHVAQLMALENRALQLGIKLEYIPPEAMQGNAGQTFPPHRWVQISSALTPNERLEILAHEMAHVFGPPTLTPAEKEVFADLVAVEYCHSVGLDIRRASASYLPMYKSGFGVYEHSKAEIEYVIGVLQGHINPYGE